MVAAGAGSGGNLDPARHCRDRRRGSRTRERSACGGDGGHRARRRRECTNQAGDTALHVAAGRGLNTVVQLLADRGAQLNAKNKRGLTPLAALMPGNVGPRRRGAAITAAAIADDDDNDADQQQPSRAPNFPETVALLKKLGATE